MPGLALMQDPRHQLAVQQATHHDVNGASSPLGIVTEQVRCPTEYCSSVAGSVCGFLRLTGSLTLVMPATDCVLGARAGD